MTVSDVSELICSWMCSQGRSGTQLSTRQTAAELDMSQSFVMHTAKNAVQLKSFRRLSTDSDHQRLMLPELNADCKRLLLARFIFQQDVVPAHMACIV